MRGRILSLRWRKLTRAGFIVENRFTGLRDFGNSLNHLFKHPAALVVLGFALTAVVGNYLAFRQSERQRQNDATVRSMDSIRASFDDLSVGFSDFHFRARRLINLENTHASPEVITTARTQYDEAAQKWKERLAADGPMLASHSAELIGDMSMGLIVSSLNIDTDLIDTCVTDNSFKKISDSSQAPLSCDSDYLAQRGIRIPNVTAASRMEMMSICFQFFSQTLRPDPRFDFQARGPVESKLTVDFFCSRDRQWQSTSQMLNSFHNLAKSHKAPVVTSPTTPALLLDMDEGQLREPQESLKK